MSQLPARRENYELSRLWRTDATLSPGRYLAWGTSLFAIKYGLDTFVAEVIFHRQWELWRYMFPGQNLDVVFSSGPDRAFYAAVTLMALPFVWAGVVLTMRRLRSAGLPVFLVYLFFVPFVNLLTFVILSTLPSIKAHQKPGQAPSAVPPGTSDGVGAPAAIPPIPNWPKPDRSLQKPQSLVVSNKPGSADARRAVMITVPAAVLLAWLGVFVLKSYGFGLFIGIPFATGMSSAYLYGQYRSKHWIDCVIVACVAVSLVGACMFLFAWEGMICLLMAAPIAYTLTFMGAVLGYFLQREKSRPPSQILLPLVLLFAMPLLMGAEYAIQPGAQPTAVTSEVEIAAPPAVVWHHVIAFPQLPPPNEWWFHAGVAYPIGATINGEGVGAVRRCNFSTGAFVEPIKVWDPPRRLGFSVEAQPPNMQELSWKKGVHPAHLSGYLQIHGGQFQLQAIAPGGSDGLTHTRLIGTTWYQNKMWPAVYWRLWSNEIIHRIHLRVLEHIRQQAEHEIAVTSY